MRFGFVFIALAAIACQAPVDNDKEYTLVWSDEFEGTGLPDEDKWNFQLGNGCPDLCGWGNNEQQVYTNDTRNVRLEEGKLIIEAHKTDSIFSSARITTQSKGEWQTGKIVVRASLPASRGTWPAIWMLPAVERLNWPEDGEIDIMEHVGWNPGAIYGTIHTEKFNHTIGTQKIDSIKVNDVSEFHDYILEWSKDTLVWKVDEEIYHVLPRAGESKAGWPFDQPFYLIMNIAIGGNWGGKLGIDRTAFPQRMEVEFVRVYQKI